MTEQEFLALKPREQDALVAEKVMEWKGYTQEECSEEPYGPEDDDMWDPFDKCWYPPGTEPYKDTPSTVDPFTTEIAAAWQAVEKMRSEGWCFWLDTVGFEGEEWRVLFMKDIEGHSRAHYVETAAVELSITIAALKAKGVIE